MKPFKDQPIARKVLLLGMVPTVAAIFLVIIASIGATYVQARTNLVSDLQAEAELVAGNVGAALAFNDQTAASETLNVYRAKTNIDAVCVYDNQGRLFASFARVTGACVEPAADLNSSASYILQEQRVLVANREVGKVRIAGNLSRLYSWTRRQALVGVVTFIIGVLFSLVLTRSLSRDITRPLQNLAATADRVSKGGDYGVRATRETGDEVGMLVGSFNGMLDHIQEQHNTSARLLEREKEASRLKDQFLAAVSHELRTPLNAILGWLQVIRTTSPSMDTIERGLDSLERNARTQARVVEDLIEISRAVTGKLHLKLSAMDLRRVVRAALDVVHPVLKAKRIRVSQSLPAEPCPISGDADRLHQVIWNLLSNAVKFTPAGGKVLVDLTEADHDFVLTVSDTGIGIAAEFIPFVFDRFRQADGSMTREHGGLGLGLAIAKDLAELHGGTLRVSSAGKGKGASFVLRLPRRVNLQADATPDSAGESETRSQGVLGGIRVLAVDDDPDALEVIAQGLRAAGARVHTALSGEEAIDAWRGATFDVLVCDLAMPRIDGFAVLQAIRRLPDSDGVFAIALSAHTLQEDRRRSTDAGFRMHLGKPFDLEELIRVVGTAQKGTVSL